MAKEEIKYFNVKNISVRLVHIGGVSIPPEGVVSVVDDVLGINRADVLDSEFLEQTDEAEMDVNPFAVEKKEAVKATAATGKTATGAGWNTANKA